MAMSASAFSQEVHPGLQNVADNINLKAEHVEMNKVDGDMAAIIKYINLALDTARKNGDQVPKDLNVEGILKALGIMDIKAYGTSSNEEDDAWVSHSYTDIGGSNTGLVSLLGGDAEEFVVPAIAPAGTDAAFQLKLDLTQLETILKNVIKNADAKELGQIEEGLSQPIEPLGMNVADLLGKMKITLNLAMDLDETHPDNTPFGPVGRPHLVGRIDGLAWAWDKVKDGLFADLPYELNEVEAGDIITYTLPDEELKEMPFGFDPVLVVDKKANQIWMASSPGFLTKCTSGKNTLAGSAEFKAAMKDLPSKGNSLAYFSKSFLKNLASAYKTGAKDGAFGEDFEKGKDIIDAIVEDLTESKHGHAYVISKDGQGVTFSARTFFGAKHLQALQGLVPLFQTRNAEDEMKKRMAPRPKRGGAL